uniref:CSON014949 protein n=1 Tax=Culicoides sonorensis TaxID=179676 RepID=A0A336LNZ9_CULSO
MLDSKRLITSIQKLKKLNAFTFVPDLTNNVKTDCSELPLNGTTFCVKDNFCSKEIKTTCGSRSGSSDSFFGPVKNPWRFKDDAWRIAAVATVNSMDTPGILTRSVTLCSQVFKTLKCYDVNDSTNTFKKWRNTESTLPLDLKKITVGIPVEYFCNGLSNEVKNVWMMVADVLKNHGAKVSEVASNLARYDGLKYGYRSNVKKSTESMFAKTRQLGFNSVVKSRILAGNFFLLKKNYDKYYVKALKVRRLIKNDFDEVFYKRNIDFLISPVTLTVAPLYSDFIKLANRDQCALQDICTQPSNMAGEYDFKLYRSTKNNRCHTFEKSRNTSKSFFNPDYFPL